MSWARACSLSIAASLALADAARTRAGGQRRICVGAGRLLPVFQSSWLQHVTRRCEF